MHALLYEEIVAIGELRVGAEDLADEAVRASAIRTLGVVVAETARVERVLAHEVHRGLRGSAGSASQAERTSSS